MKDLGTTLRTICQAHNSLLSCTDPKRKLEQIPRLLCSLLGSSKLKIQLLWIINIMSIQEIECPFYDINQNSKLNLMLKLLSSFFSGWKTAERKWETWLASDFSALCSPPPPYIPAPLWLVERICRSGEKKHKGWRKTLHGLVLCLKTFTHSQSGRVQSWLSRGSFNGLFGDSRYWKSSDISLLWLAAIYSFLRS